MYLTNILRPGEAFGAVFQGLIWDILFCECNGYEFVYQNMPEIFGNYDNRKNFYESLICYMAVKGNYLFIDDVSDNDVNKNIIRELKYDMIEKNIDLVHNSPSFHKYKQFFYKGKSSRFDNNYFNVAVHIRRPNKYDVRIEGADTSNTYYKNIMNTIREKHNDKKIMFHIYSQGDLNNFSDLIGADVTFHLDEFLLDTFTDFVFADALIISASSFSYTAALLSNGEIYYMPFWHKPLSNWIVCTIN
jgi:hypothetical protein